MNKSRGVLCYKNAFTVETKLQEIVIMEEHTGINILHGLRQDDKEDCVNVWQCRGKEQNMTRCNSKQKMVVHSSSSPGTFNVRSMKHCGQTERQDVQQFPARFYVCFHIIHVFSTDIIYDLFGLALLCVSVSYVAIVNVPLLYNVKSLLCEISI